MSKNTADDEINPHKKKYSAPALEKGLDIIELLSSEVDGLNISQLTTKLGRTVGEIFRMLAVLEQRAYIELPESGDRYRLTLKMFRLSNRFPPIKRLTTIAGPIMHKLAYSIEQSCHLVIYLEGWGHIVAQQDSPSERILSVRLGAKAPLLRSCSGHVLLAYSNEQQRKIMLKKIPTNHIQSTNGKTKEMIKKVIARGYESIKSEQIQGVQDFGYPIFDTNSQIVAALVVPFVSFLDKSHPVSIKDAQPQILKAASSMSALLGFTILEQ